MNELLTFGFVPTFCVKVTDNTLADLGLYAGDVLFCDGETAQARRVIATYADDPDGVFHVCTLIGGRYLWDEGSQRDAPEDAKVWGRVLYVQRSLVPLEHGEKAAP